MTRDRSKKQSAADRREWRLFDNAVRQACAAFANLPPEEIAKVVDAASREVLAERRVKLLDDRSHARQQSSRPRMRKKQGIWVFSLGNPITQKTADDALRKTRSDRDRKNAGDFE